MCRISTKMKLNQTYMKSAEVIGPSSPTPPDLRKLQLSFLDQLCPPIHIHIIFYFQQPLPQPHRTSETLKQSLSEALSVYYPLAGRLQDHGSWIDCNDAGAEYMEAWFEDASLVDIMGKSQPDELRQYVPAMPCGGIDVPLAVQVSFFGCGGIAIGVCISHRVADATSMVTFVNTWAAACQGDVKSIVVTQPSFGLASRFPPVDMSRFFSSAAPPPTRQPPEKIVTRRFIFNKWKVSALRNATSGPLLMNPTRVETVSAFLWRHYIESITSKEDRVISKSRTFAATHVADIRQRANPPLPHQYFGNACARAMAMSESPTNDEPYSYYDLAMKLRSSISKADSSYVRTLEDGDNFMKYYCANEENDPAFKDGGKTLETCSFTSWCRLPAYEADFGWGKPAWVSIMGVPQRNLIVFLGTKSGDGIEAWVNMTEEAMDVIERSYNVLHQIEAAVKLKQELM